MQITLHKNIKTEDAIVKIYLNKAPTIIGKAHNWNALLRPSPSAIQPLNTDPRKAPPRHVLTTKPSIAKDLLVRKGYNR